MKHALARWLMVLLAAGLALTAACSSGNNNKAANSSNTNTNSGQSNTGAGVKPSGPVLSDCDYAKRVQAATQGLLSSGLGTLNSALGTATTDPQAAITQQVDTFNKALGGLIGGLQGLNLPPDLKQFNDQIVAAFQDTQKGFNDAAAAAKAGDVNKAQQIATKTNSDTSSRIDQIQKNNKTASDRLSKCS